MPGIETVCGHDMPAVHDKRTSTRIQHTDQTPASSGNVWCKGKQYHEQLSQSEAVQPFNIQDTLHTGLPRCNPEIWDNRLIQYADSRFCPLSHRTEPTYLTVTERACPP